MDANEAAAERMKRLAEAATAAVLAEEQRRYDAEANDDAACQKN